MKTILTKEIDGYTIITGFDNPVIDPVATKIYVAGLLKDEITEEKKNVDNKQKELFTLQKNKNDLMNMAKQKVAIGDKRNLAILNYQIEQRDEQIDFVNKELSVLIKKQIEKEKEIFQNNSIYFETKPGEIVIDDETAGRLGKLCIENEYVDVGGNIIENNKGVRFIKDGKIITIEKIGVKPDGPLMQDVSAEQYDVMRINALSAEEKQAEIDNVSSFLLSDAAAMRSRLEIQGVADALAQSQKWYQDEIAKLKQKYAV
jgi:hypothetical protein